VFINGHPLVEPYLPIDVRTSSFGPVTIPEGHVWMMGDNRSNSRDSRVFGPIATTELIGRAFAKVWPPGSMSFL
jgi:signal peptidase I